MNTNAAVSRHLMRTARTLEAEWRHILRVSVSTGEKEDESGTGRVWVAEFRHVTTCSHLVGLLKLTNQLFI
jgi:hypothetical protein